MKTNLVKIILGIGVMCILAPQANSEDLNTSREANATEADVSHESSGGLFFEPAITSEQGDTKTSFPGPLSDSSGKAEGFGLGARLGVHLREVFFLGLDGRYSQAQYKDSSVNYDARSVSTNLGPVVGMQFPNIGLRAWGSYILLGELNPERSGSFDVNFQEAKGYRVGAGFRLAAVSLNLEYQELRYGKMNVEQFGPFAPGTLDDVSMENKAWVASLSFPLEL